MKEIYPFLWYNTEAEEAAKLYTSIFKNGRLSNVAQNPGDVPGPKHVPIMVEFDIAGRHFMALNGGPAYHPTAAISMFVSCETEDEVQKAWDALTKGGEVRMELGEYPWSKKYGWVKDRYGLEWQLNLTGQPQSIAPAFLFTGDVRGRAEEAIEFWTKEFPNSSIDMISRYEEYEQGPTGKIKYSSFKLNGQPFVAMDSGVEMPEEMKFTPGTSMYINCDTQQEVDKYWDELGAGGRYDQCGWLQDRFGVSWQVIPTRLGEFWRQGNPARLQNMMNALMGMKKLIISELEEAYDEPVEA
jgi:predicted 3-demethylubiquinone-9 3-methyltransferase (glyoxalase superfamily)